MIRIITESKQDIQNFRDKYGDELTDEFLLKRKTLRPPYNDIYFWLKDNPLKDKYIEDDKDELECFLNDFIGKSRTQQRKEAKSGADIIYKDNDWIVLGIYTYESAVYYGKNTKWCISGNYEYDSPISAEDYFLQHEGYIFFIDRKANKKYCYQIDEDILWDETDNILYEGGDWEDEDSVKDINPMPRIETDEGVCPYIYIDEDTDEKVYVNSDEEEQYRLSLE